MKYRLKELNNLNDNFYRWFGDSKVVDNQGKPIVVYHGTSAKFRAFNKKKAAMGGIFWFTTNKQEVEDGNVGAAGHGVILELYARIINPAGWKEYEKLGLGQLVDRGYDGVILEHSDGFIGFVFEPNQLKSINNKGTWSLNSNKINEMAYPTQFSFEKLLSLTSYKKRLDYVQSLLQRISSGSSRVVYKVDDEKVLKIARNKKGLAQNEVESDEEFQYMYPSLVAKVFEKDKNNLFLEMELARKVTPTKFKQVLGFTTDDLTRLLENTAYRAYGNNKTPSYWSKADEGLEHLWDNEFVMSLTDYAVNFNIPIPGDLDRLSSYGLVTREGQESIVLIDFGLTQYVYDTHYGRR